MKLRPVGEVTAGRADLDKTVYGSDGMKFRVGGGEALTRKYPARRRERKFACPHAAFLFRLISAAKHPRDPAVNQADVMRTALAVIIHIPFRERSIAGRNLR